MKKWLAAIMAAGCIFFGGFGVANAADWYYVDADTDDSAWFIDNSSVFKTDSMARILVKATTQENLTSWIKAGVFCVGMGSKLFPKDKVAAEDWTYVTEKCKEALGYIAEARK